MCVATRNHASGEECIVAQWIIIIIIILLWACCKWIHFCFNTYGKEEEKLLEGDIITRVIKLNPRALFNPVKLTP
jgi:hypothetical protein